jgi:hypothetical protein
LTFLTEIPTNKKRVTYKSNENDWLSDDDKFVILAKTSSSRHVPRYQLFKVSPYYNGSSQYDAVFLIFFFCSFLADPIWEGVMVLASIGSGSGCVRRRREVCHWGWRVLPGPGSTPVVQVFHAVHASLAFHKVIHIDLIETTMDLVWPLKWKKSIYSFNFNILSQVNRIVFS